MRGDDITLPKRRASDRPGECARPVFSTMTLLKRRAIDREVMHEVERMMANIRVQLELIKVAKVHGPASALALVRQLARPGRSRR